MNEGRYSSTWTIHTLLKLYSYSEIYNKIDSNTWKNNPIVNQNVNRIAYLGYGYINSGTTDRCCSPQGASHGKCQYLHDGSYCRDWCSKDTACQGYSEGVNDNCQIATTSDCPESGELIVGETGII